MERLVERAFPGMGWRPLWLTVLASAMLVVYSQYGRPSRAPDWWLEWSAGVWGIDISGFHRHTWAHATAVLLLMFVPLFSCLASRQWTWRELGLGLRGSGREWVWVLLMWLAFLPVVWHFSGTASFQRTYPKLKPIASDVALFWQYEGWYLAKWAAWEFFFRGFMLFGLGKDLKGRSVLMSTIAFTLMHAGKPFPEFMAAIAAGLILCFIALKARSIWPGVLLHWLVATTMDLFSSDWWR